jgi:hypothetical protein
MSADRKRQKIILIALFTALAVVLGYLMAAVPNIELMTLTVFLGGMLTGFRCGALIGILSILIFSMFNPYGAALPPLLAAQMAGFALIGAAGGLLRGTVRRYGMAAAAIAGLSVTLFYDILTTLASAYITLGSESFVDGLIGFFAASAVFILIHTGVNTLIFSQAVTAVARFSFINDAYGEIS